MPKSTVAFFNRDGYSPLVRFYVMFGYMLGQAVAASVVGIHSGEACSPLETVGRPVCHTIALHLPFAVACICPLPRIVSSASSEGARRPQRKKGFSFWRSEKVRRSSATFCPTDRRPCFQLLNMLPMLLVRKVNQERLWMQWWSFHS